jgi:hypothetical protein
LIILAVSLVYQLQFVVSYTPLHKTQAKDSNKQTKENSFTLLVSNVQMENDYKESFHALVNKYKPDILLINEPDQGWAASIIQQVLKKQMPARKLKLKKKLKMALRKVL